jgi:hypothetical protein
VRWGLVLVAAPARLLARWLAYWPFRYEVRGISARNDRGVADHLAVTATMSFVCMDNFALAASILLPRISFMEAPFAAKKEKRRDFK